MTPDEARKDRQELLQKQELTKDEMLTLNNLTVIALSDIPSIQHWVLSSAGPPRNGWTEAKWKKFHRQLPSMLSHIDVPIYRGTKFPWIEGGHKSFKDLEEIQDQIKEFDDNFSKKKIIKVRRIMPFTKDRKIANRFASEAEGYKTDEGYTFDKGFIHVIKPSIKGVDVAPEVAKVHKNVFDDNDEIAVSKREKEVLIIPGTRLQPVGKQGRVYTWEVVSHKASKTRKRRE